MMYLIYEGRVGEYVRYVAGKKVFPVKPSVSGIQDVQYVKTARTKRWRIYRKEGDVLEIISDEPVAAVSVYGVRGFSNIIYMANSISNAFIDNKYAFSARSIGCSDESIEKLRFSTNIMTLKDAWQNNYSDPFYLADFSRINRHRLLTCSDTPILLASRQVEKIGRKMCFCIRTMDNSGRHIDFTLFSSTPGNPFHENKLVVGIRVVVSLHSKVLFNKGDGTFKKPYELAGI